MGRRCLRAEERQTRPEVASASIWSIPVRSVEFGKANHGNGPVRRRRDLPRPSRSSQVLSSTSPRSRSLLRQHVADLDHVGAHAQRVETHCRQVRGEDTGLAAVGDQPGRGSSARRRIAASMVCQRLVRLRCLMTSSKSASAAFISPVIGVELAVGEPEPVVGARVEEAVIVVFRPVLQQRRGRGRCRWRCGRDRSSVVGARVEHSLAASPAAC